MKLNSFVIADAHKCIGCKACELACAASHSDNDGKTVGTVETPIMPRLFLVKTAEVTVPIQCRQCEDAPCANVCPVRAISQLDNKIVVDTEACIGCKTCIMACPFGAMDLVPKYKDGQLVTQNVLMSETDNGLVKKEVIVAHKCDLCIDQPDGPACVRACPEKALELIVPKQVKKKRNIEAVDNLWDAVKGVFD
ncbi:MULTISPECIES: 4Fe-4S dicluster domain-containing protein [Clostridium]|uniref:Electron transport protein HydN n=3 Tax=Clostridium TaxID=1485 RepID=D8GUC7_CLOLD|nr:MULTISPECIES: 4Fe-4S dicluster domain-containing protein [Clostridium]ADK14790.1 predicted electron transport protein [Clostridium ljungdahlii DSM 13528]AGY78041.1 4Fe-4S dicluster domain-containing protein [Clostridium autoethanogenum DSM 10061]ALU38175.1 4Fe-4S ferredoxin iron-sulpur binding domain-containing protein [Clostridium autoethanogenum DSM 10061]OAA85991.1 Electron transport protein HydN [Clostridium ljungdahlii DSM 13528]OVY50939.1 Electron transport protein HydN [Clostridium a